VLTPPPPHQACLFPLTTNRNKLAQSDIIWEALFKRDFATTSSLGSTESWKEKYQACALTLRWDPEFAEAPLVFEEDNRKCIRGTGGMFSKAMAFLPINTQMSHTLHFTSNKRFYMGFFASPSKKDLHTAVFKQDTSMLVRLNLFPGRATLISLYGGNQTVKSQEGTLRSTGMEVLQNEFGVVPPSGVDLKVHINAETQTIEWELNGVRLQQTPPLPFPPPIFLVYQSGDPSSEIVSEWV